MTHRYDLNGKWEFTALKGSLKKMDAGHRARMPPHGPYGLRSHS